MNIAIIGAGASGMIAALEAAKKENHKVMLFERQQRVGRKLMSTGNGRCNLTNTAAEAGRGHYHGQNSDFPDAVLKNFPPEKVCEYFSKLGLFTREEYGGRIFPLSNSANSVVDILRYAMDARNIEVHTGCEVTAVKKTSGGFLIKTEQDSYPAERLIVACGGCAGAKLGGVQDGYKILQSLGHHRTKLFPALVQIVAEDPRYPRALKGIRAENVKLELSGAVSARSKGELLFTEKGVSGPAAFDLSRAAASVPNGDKLLHIDFLSDYDEDSVFRALQLKAENYPQMEASELYTGIVHNRLGKMLVKYAGINPTTAMQFLSTEKLSAAANAGKDFQIRIKGTEGFEQAQVTAGGISTDEFDPGTLESRFVPGLFACGEVLDVDGDCGGFNLQWAWASGITAGRIGE